MSFKSKLLKTLGFRLVLWYSAVFIFSSLLLFVATYFFLYRSLSKSLDNVIITKYGEFASLYEKRGESVFFLNPFHYLIRLADSKNQTLFLSPVTMQKDFPIGDLEKIPVNEKRQWIQIRSYDKDNLLRIMGGRLPNGQILEIGRATTNSEDLLEHFQVIFALMVAAGVAVGLAAGIFFSSRALKPVRDLIQTVQTIAQTGKVEARVPIPEARDELAELVELFNQMLEKIQRVISGMKEALDNVAHDLRTPMTRLRASAEMALQKEDVSQLKEALSDSMEESEKVLTMLEALMDISEAEAGTLKLAVQIANLADLARDVADLYEPVASEKNITLGTDLPESLMARVDPNRMREVLANLTDNALKYTEPGGSVVLAAFEEKDTAVIQVKDTGIGIPEDEVPRIWERLYRGDKSRSKHGLGLGLSLVKAIVEAHHGSVEVSSHPGQGSVFSVRLSKM